MNYVSGLMLGASLVNMLRQSMGGTGETSPSANGTGGGRGRAQGGGASGFSSAAGGFALGGAALTGLFGGGRMGGGASPLTSLLGMTGRGGSAQLSSGFFGGGRKGGDSSARMAQEPAPVPTQMRGAAEQPFVCVHASCGRRRYRTPYLTPEFAKVLEARLARLPFVAEVRANALAGSILLVYAPEDEAHILILAEGLEAIFAEGRTAPPPATLAQSVRRSVHDFSGWIQRNTGGALDLSSVVAGVFVLRGIRQLVLTNNTPSGSQMLWWALTLMRGWKV